MEEDKQLRRDSTVVSDKLDVNLRKNLQLTNFVETNSLGSNFNSDLTSNYSLNKNINCHEGEIMTDSYKNKCTVPEKVVNKDKNNFKKELNM